MLAMCCLATGMCWGGHMAAPQETGMKQGPLELQDRCHAMPGQQRQEYTPGKMPAANFKMSLVDASR